MISANPKAADYVLAHLRDHPSVVVYYRPITTALGPYDLREIAMWLVENDYPDRAFDVWHGPQHADGSWGHFLGYEVELAAYKLITAACVDCVYEHRDTYAVYRPHERPT